MTTSEAIRSGLAMRDKVTAKTLDYESYYNWCRLQDFTQTNPRGQTAAGRYYAVDRDTNGNIINAVLV